MKFLIKKNYIILLFITILFTESPSFSKEKKNEYKRENLSNYFSGIVLLKNNYSKEAFKHLNKVQSIKKIHSQFNVEFIRTHVFLKKFEDAFAFSKSVWKEEKLFFEADLLLGLESFVKKDYSSAEKYFKRLNKISLHNLLFEDLIGNVLIAWSKASQEKKEESFNILEKIPTQYRNLISIQNIFLQCHFDMTETEQSFKNLIEDKEYNFSRYNFFLVNYLLSKNKTIDAKKIIKNSRKKYSSNLLLKQAEKFLLNDDNKKIKNFFNCKNPKDAIAEFFYVLANLYSSEKDYQLSNFYLRISNFLNNKFLTNKALLAENFYYQKKNKNAKKIYYSLKPIGQVYSWHASKNIAAILTNEKGKKESIESLEKDFNLLEKSNFEHYYELANFYKNHEYFEKSIEYYSLALSKIKKNHFLVPKILDRRGTSFERLGNWKNAEKDLMESLKILPDQAHVLNYLAYTWIDHGINLDEGLEMLKKAAELKENDGYIIDSLGWAYYAKKSYKESEYFLQQAVELLPSEPVINDHYADALWMLNKKIQARYFWSYALKLNGLTQELKDTINKKLLFGINKKL